VRRFAQIRASWPIYRLTVGKEIARGHALDAFGLYGNGLVRPLIELAGMRYRPERFDYGLALPAPRPAGGFAASAYAARLRFLN
jgi:hypothetical protein